MSENLKENMQEVPEHLLCFVTIFLSISDDFFFFIKKKLRRFLSSIFFNLLEHLEASSFHFTLLITFLFVFFFFLLLMASLRLAFNFVEKNLTNGSRPRQPMSSTVPQ
jgi:hypothetical protein